MLKIGDYEKIMSDRNIFNQIVYTPMSEALKLLEERRKDPELIAKVERLLKGDIPEILKNKKSAVLHRQVATPNHESLMFLKLAKENELYPVFFEYYDDKFVPENDFKHSLGQLHIKDKKEFNQNGDSRFEKFTIVDFKKHGGKKFREINTLWEEPLTDFHKKLFAVHDYNPDDLNFFDGSNWYKNNGEKAINYYTNFFLLFACFGILFENFLMSRDDKSEFTKNIVLPAIENMTNLIGVKPLITPIGPLEIETDVLWYHHNYKVRDVLIKKQK